MRSQALDNKNRNTSQTQSPTSLTNRSSEQREKELDKTDFNMLQIINISKVSEHGANLKNIEVL